MYLIPRSWKNVPNTEFLCMLSSMRKFFEEWQWGLHCFDHLFRKGILLSCMSSKHQKSICRLYFNCFSLSYYYYFRVKYWQLSMKHWESKVPRLSDPVGAPFWDPGAPFYAPIGASFCDSGACFCAPVGAHICAPSGAPFSDPMRACFCAPVGAHICARVGACFSAPNEALERGTAPIGAR